MTALPLGGEGGLLDVLGGVVDPRMPRGVRHRVEVVLAFAVCAMLAGSKSLQAIAQWAGSQPLEVIGRLGAGRFGPPSDPTFRRVLGAIDAAAFDRQLGAWFCRFAPLAGEAIAIDGKTLRGAADGEQKAPHLVSALVHGIGIVIAQHRVADKTNEITSVEPLLRGVDIGGAVVTGDAMFAQKRIAEHLVEDKRADYLFTVKDNQPTLRADIEALGLDATPPCGMHDGQGSRAHRDARVVGERRTQRVR